MVEEAASASEEASVTEMEQTLAAPATEIETLEAAPGSIEATVESVAHGGTESTCNDGGNNNNNNNVAESAAAADVPDEEREKTLEFAEELTERGSTALKEEDFDEATDCFSRALEIRVMHHGELAVECMNAYYQYGRALLHKAQAEADPLGNMPKKEESSKDGSVKNAVNGESSATSFLSKADQQGNSNGTGSDGKDQEEDGEDSNDEDLGDVDEDESDLDFAWKMLDIARAIGDKYSADTMEKVDILSTLAEVSLEREDIESSLSDYQKALAILERLVEPDSRHLAELNFRICLCLETGSKPQEAIPYCQKAISICKARVERLTNEVKSVSGSAASSTVSEVDEGIQQSSNLSYIDKSAPDKEAEIGNLSGLAEELEKKLEDLQQHAQNPKSILSELLGNMVSAKANAGEKAASASAAMSSSQMGNVNTNTSQGLDSPTISTAHTGGGASGGVTHLGVVGRGVKRVLMNPTTSAESIPAKKPAPESSDKADGNSS
ncbi:PREDICTED: NASP-related protein sim3 isoform X2 [Tarenaya hassleriana]|uniref:NASP-related protein sim3 isoform X2 n=1 Tax=Tarenaya hassleriana TaxID=28532 RepID=UPI00053C59CF|nr:PREDICTED: NASP-related protein sim3 isoform X2 [Tarenaya hassleriana]